MKYKANFKNAGFQVGTWGYNYFNHTDTEGKIIIEALDNSDYYVFDTEVDVSNKFTEAETVCISVRNARPNAVLGYSSFPIVSLHLDIPYTVFNKYCNFASPQAYWGEMQWDINKCIDKMLSDHNYYNLNLPIYPTIQTYGVSSDSYVAYSKYVFNKSGAWSLDDMDSTFESFISLYRDAVIIKIIESNLSFRSLDYSNVPDMIVLHHAEISSCTIQDIHQLHLDLGWAGCGYHFFVRKDGSIYRGRPENAVGAHCPAANNHSIGICAEGNYMNEQMPEVQKQAIIELCKYICNKYNFKTIYGHRELSETDCPGTNYPLDFIKNIVITGTALLPTTTTTTPPVVNVNRTWLQVGDTGTTVKSLQINLIKLGFSCGPSGADGIYGKVTKNAVYKFQQSLNIQADGLAGIQTQQVINEILATPLCKQGITSGAVRYIQYRVGCAVDGIFGSKTASAVMAWQKKNKLAVDGIVGPATWGKLIP